MAGGGDEDVLRLEVAVDEAVHVEVLDAAQDLRGVEARRALVQPVLRLGLAHVVEVAARAVLHEVAEPALRLEGGVQSDDERVGAGREDLELLHDVRDALALLHHAALGEHLEREELLGGAVLHEVDLRRAALVQLLDHHQLLLQLLLRLVLRTVAAERRRCGGGHEAGGGGGGEQGVRALGLPLAALSAIADAAAALADAAAALADAAGAPQQPAQQRLGARGGSVRRVRRRLGGALAAQVGAALLDQAVQLDQVLLVHAAVVGVAFSAVLLQHVGVLRAVGEQLLLQHADVDARLVELLLTAAQLLLRRQRLLLGLGLRLHGTLAPRAPCAPPPRRAYCRRLRAEPEDLLRRLSGHVCASMGVGGAASRGALHKFCSSANSPARRATSYDCRGGSEGRRAWGRR